MRARIAAVAALVLASTVLSTGPAGAAAPSNDSLAGAVIVGSLPFTDQVDTTEATSDAEDADIADQCSGVPAFDASVWYQVTPQADTGIVADMSASDYPTGAFVATGGPGSWSLVACAPGAVGWEALAKVTYYVVAFDDQSDGGGNGGLLSITFDTAPLPPAVDLTVKPTGTFNATTGEATVRGTITCTGESEFSLLDVQLSQTVGRFIIRGTGFTEFACDGTTRPWSVIVAGENGRFDAGKALSVTTGVACGTFVCGVDFEERIVRLRRAGG